MPYSLRNALYSLRTVLSAILLLLPLASPAQAQDPSCGDVDSAWPVFEDLKAQFRDGNYRAFLENSGPMMTRELENYDSYFSGLDSLFPDGFDSCHTVLARMERPAFRQEIVMYLHQDLQGPISVLLTGVRIDGTEQLVYFNFNSQVTAVLQELR